MSIVIFLLAIDDWLFSQLLFGPCKLIFTRLFWVRILSWHISHLKGNDLGCQMLFQNLFLNSWSLSPNVGLFDSSPWLYIVYFCLDFNKVNNTALHINFKLFLCSDILQNRLSNSWCLYYFKFIQLIFQGCLLQICHLFTLIVLWLSFGWESKHFVRQV